jgi:hypothetical protein
MQTDYDDLPMSDTLPRYEERRKEGQRRIRLERIDTKAEQQKSYEKRDRSIPGDVVWARSAYEMYVDSAMIGYLLCEGAYRSTRWTVYSLRAVKKGFNFRTAQRLWDKACNDPAKLGNWLADHYKDGSNYPTRETIEAEAKAEAERQEQLQQEMKSERAERDKRRHERRAAAQTALDGLREIEKLNLSNYQKAALSFAIEEVGRIAED